MNVSHQRTPVGSVLRAQHLPRGCSGLREAAANGLDTRAVPAEQSNLRKGDSRFCPVPRTEDTPRSSRADSARPATPWPPPISVLAVNARVTGGGQQAVEE